MPTNFENSRFNNPVLLVLVFFTLFVAASMGLVQHERAVNEQKFKTHAAIIADDVWALDSKGTATYLQLAQKTGNFESLKITIPGNETLVYIPSQGQNGLNFILAKLQLIPLQHLNQDIIYEGMKIGTLQGEQHLLVIYKIVNLFLILLLVMIIGSFVLGLSINRNKLEQLVQERTNNLLESERRFHDLVNLLPEMIIETDLTGRITYANEEASKRINQKTLVGSPVVFFDFVLEQDRELVRRNFARLLKNQPMGNRELTVVDGHGVSFPALIRSSVIEQNREITGTRIIIVDMTEQRQMEKQLRRDQKMKAIGMMAGGVAHDLNNILSGIISYPELIMLELDQDSPMRRPLEAIHRSGLDAAEVVADLLTVARGVAAHREITDFNKLIRDYFASPDFEQLKMKYPQVIFNVSLSANLKPISCSPIHIRKCLMNLITNGLEAIDGIGDICISTSNFNQTASKYENGLVLAEGSYVRFLIQDSGSGISAAEIDHIFEPFYTKKVMGRSGTGLGLAIVWNTMRDHGGRVLVSSSSGGTIFELYFPSVDSSTLSITPKSNWKDFCGNHQKILVIDDEKRQTEITSQLLTILKYDPVAVNSGEEAIAYLRNNHADLLLLDMIMAPGINGRETYAQIKQFKPRQRAVIASGFAEDKDVSETLTMGASVFISKPFTLDQLGNAVYNSLYQEEVSGA